MPRVHYVKKARKDNPAVSAGEPYYWWKFRYGGKHYSATPPRRSQLTQSAFLSELYELEDTLAEPDTLGELEEIRDELVKGLEELRDMAQESLDSMPEPLQEGDTGQLLQERVDGLEGWVSDLESLSFETEDDESETDAVTRLFGEMEASNPGLG